ncbi:MAG: glycosyltransferase family 39 protein [Candidatus Aenigmarchaeota archaeon]|nr:glycosyltransferase family 39 protein [Candidatus Aenigmarchaeota archaeon]
MKKQHKKIAMKILPPLIIFCFALLLRLCFFTGFILGDDIEEFQVMQYVMDNGPELHTAAHIRFGMWLFNVISFSLFGISELSFFLPTWLMSSSLGVIGYYLLLFWKYSRHKAFLAGLFIASAPFEILIGVLRANDLIFSWVLALALYSFVVFEKKPVIQGVLLAFLIWFAFYIKLWVIYLLPALGLYYLYNLVRHKKWQGLASFVVASVVIHGITCIVWKIKTGVFMPYLYYHSATYPVPERDLPWLFQIYPKFIFQGSEFGTTLFGLVPYILISLLVLKVILPRIAINCKKIISFDRLDIYLIAYYTSFFLLINFFPNTFNFDQYYSAPRIFRYLTPLSFPMTLHIAKLILDFNKIKLSLKGIGISRKNIIRKYSIVLLFLLLICVNIYQADNATKPGQIYRESLLAIVNDIKEQSPPELVMESWLSFFMREIYLKDNNNISIIPIYSIYDAKEYEKWLHENQNNLTEGSTMITGLACYVHYGCHNCGFRLRQFTGSLDPGWKLFREYDNLTYLPIPEPARLWKWSPSD